MRPITVNFRLVVEHLDPYLNRTRIAFADAGLQIHQHFFAAHGVEFPQFRKLKRRFPGDGLSESLMAGLPRDFVIQWKCHAIWNRDHRLCLTATDPADMFCNRLECWEAHALETKCLRLDPASPENFR